MDPSRYYSLLLALVFAVAAGLVGSFAFMKRMLLASDVISHLALPGLGIAFLLKIDPVAGGAATLLLGAFLIWRLQLHTGLSSDTTIGVVFAASLAIGAAITPSEDLLEALFGASHKLSLSGFVLGLTVAAFVIFSIVRLKSQLVLSIFSPELAAATGVKVSRLDLYFLFFFSLTVLLGLRFTGALLGSALLIVPAATAHQLTTKMSQFAAVSCLVSVFSVAAGWSLNSLVFRSTTPSPTIIIVSTVLFGLSLLKRA